MITELIIFQYFFSKAQYSLAFLFKIRTREPYLSCVFNSAREEFVEARINQADSFSKVSVNISIAICRIL